VLLLDEPLGALDMKLRKAMQLELKNLQERVGITFDYVTHDQEEALTMSDRIAVMKKGRILLVDEPPDSWAYLFDEGMASGHAGKFTMLNDVREAMGAALKCLGYSLNSTDQEELAEARALLIEQKQWVHSYNAENYEDMLSANETVMAHSWSGSRTWEKPPPLTSACGRR